MSSQNDEERGYNLDLDLRSVSHESCVPYPKIGRITNRFRSIYLTSGNSTTRTLMNNDKVFCITSMRASASRTSELIADVDNLLPCSWSDSSSVEFQCAPRSVGSGSSRFYSFVASARRTSIRLPPGSE